MLAGISASDLDLYRECERIDPWGQTREDWRAAVQTAALVAAQGVKKSNGEAFTADEFLLTFKKGLKPDVKAFDAIQMVLDPEHVNKNKGLTIQEAMAIRWARLHNAQFGLDEYGNPLEPQTEEPPAESSQPADATENT